MGPVLVEVRDVVSHEAFELSLVPDDGSVEELLTDGAGPALSERVGHRSPDRGPEDLEALGAKDLVEGIGELAAPVPHQRPGVGELIGVAEEQVAGGLGGPGPGGVGGHPGEEDLAGGHVDEEQHVVAAE